MRAGVRRVWGEGEARWGGRGEPGRARLVLEVADRAADGALVRRDELQVDDVEARGVQLHLRGCPAVKLLCEQWNDCRCCSQVVFERRDICMGCASRSGEQRCSRLDVHITSSEAKALARHGLGHLDEVEGADCPADVVHLLPQLGLLRAERLLSAADSSGLRSMWSSPRATPQRQAPQAYSVQISCHWSTHQGQTNVPLADGISPVVNAAQTEHIDVWMLPRCDEGNEW